METLNHSNFQSKLFQHFENTESHCLAATDDNRAKNGLGSRKLEEF